MSDWHPEDIMAEVRKRGVTMSQLGRITNVPGQQLRHALTLPRENAERAIAEFLGVAAATIWPSRYQLDGTRKRPQPPENYDRRPRFDNPAKAA